MPDNDEDARKFLGSEENDLRKALAAHLKAKGYKLQADKFKRKPRAKDYAYGPELIVSGVMVNSKPVLLGTGYAANEIDLSVTPEIGSCPYLLSWDDKAKYWVNEGKVLHEAPSAGRAYMETRRFEGLKTSFRIEEREPEVAHLKNPRLQLTLENGEMLEIASTDAQRNSGDLELRWGLVTNFATPEDLDPRRVIETTLRLEGFYWRYTSMVANDIAVRISSRVRRDLRRAE